jgi:hypothetical protein
MSLYRGYFAPGGLDPSGHEFQNVHEFVLSNPRGHRVLKYKVVLLAQITDRKVCIKVNIRRMAAESGEERFRRAWNRQLHYTTQFGPGRNGETRGISSGGAHEDNEPDIGKIKGWLYPNFAYLLNGCDAANKYGGYWESGTPDEFDVNGDLIPGTVIQHEDDDFLLVKMKLTGERGRDDCGAKETNCWHPLGDRECDRWCTLLAVARFASIQIAIAN